MRADDMYLAIDLREVLSAQRIANELERICDYAEDLTERLVAIRTSGDESGRRSANRRKFSCFIRARAACG